MKNCWGVLQMQPTNDVDAIKRARRSLIKEWHPDIAVSAEDKQRRTSRCSEINAACDEAVRLANGWKRTPADPDADRETTIPTHRIVRTSFAVKHFSLLFVLGLVLFIVALRVMFPAVVVLITFLIGVGLIGFIDLLLFWLLIKPLLSKIGLQQIPAWFLLLLANILISRLWLSQIGDRLFGEVLGPAFSLGIVVAVPLWRLMRWCKELVTNDRIKETFHPDNP
jgi:hypothetical protein